jgi:hypothetical protein
MINLNCEKMPRRTSCQILNINKKKFGLLNFWFKKRNKKKNIFKNKKFFFILFDFSLSSFRRNSKKINISLSFGYRVIFKELALITPNTNEKQKKRSLIYFIKRKNGKIINSNLLKKFKKNHFSKKINKNFNFLIESNSRYLNLIEKAELNTKYLHSLFYIKRRKNFIFSFVKAFSNSVLKINENFFFLKIKCNNCPKKIKNNFFQILGNIIEYIPKGFKKIKKISIKYNNSSIYEIFVKHNFL